MLISTLEFISGEMRFTLGTNPVRTIDKDNKRIFIYETSGFTENMISVKPEFVNRTGEFYINIKGEHIDCYLEIEKNIDIRLLIDKTIYDSYSVFCVNGLLIVEFHEILKEIPDIKRVP